MSKTQPSHVAIHIVTWNSRRHIGDCLKSIMAQTFRDFQVLVVDNASQDGTVELIRERYPMVGLYQNKSNVGFARGHNQALQLTTAPLVVVCNPDILLTETWLETLVQRVAADTDKRYGSFGGKLIKLTMLNDEYHETQMTTILDSAGLTLLPYHRAIDRGAGEEATTLTAEADVFGHSGALAMYRREALDSVGWRPGNRRTEYVEYFDEDFFSYKEDVDLAWRLQWLGWQALFVPSAEAYHVRTMSGSETTNRRGIMRQRRQQPALNKYYSYRNHLLMLIKNEPVGIFLRRSPRILWHELQKLVYILLLEQSTARGLIDTLKLMPRMLAKRRALQQSERRSPEQVTHWL